MHVNSRDEYEISSRNLFQTFVRFSPSSAFLLHQITIERFVYKFVISKKFRRGWSREEEKNHKILFSQIHYSLSCERINKWLSFDYQNITKIFIQKGEKTSLLIVKACKIINKLLRP